MSAPEINGVKRKEVRNLQRVIESTGGNLIIAEHEEKLWATDQFFIVPATAFSLMLTYWNLPLAPGRFRVGETVTPQEGGKTPDVSPFLTLPEDAAQVAPLRIGGFNEALIRLGIDKFAALFETPHGVAALDDEKRQFVESRCGRGEWRMTGLVKPAYYVRDDQVAGVLMPIRITWDEAQKQAEPEAVPA